MKISVCIATYNGEKYIKEQLCSILTQLSDNDEIIVSDSGSADNTLQVIKALDDNRISVVHYAKPAVQNTNAVWIKMDNIRRNFENALKQAKGDYIFLSDQDDCWKPNKVETMMSYLQTAQCVVHDCEVFDGKNVLLPSIMDFYKPCTGVMGTIMKSPFMGCCMAFRKSVLDICLPMPSMHIEYDTWIGLCAYKLGKVVLVKEPLISYRRHGLNASSCAESSTNSLKIKLLRRFYIAKAYLSIKTKCRKS